MIVHIFTIKICGMVNETIISTYEIVNLRTILIFVGKKYFSETRGGLKMSTYVVLEGGQPNVYVRLQGGEGGQKCPEFCLRGLYTVPKGPIIFLIYCPDLQIYFMDPIIKYINPQNLRFFEICAIFTVQCPSHYITVTLIFAPSKFAH